MEKNVGNFDKLIRLIGGVILIYLSFVIEDILLRTLIMALAIIAIVESSTGYCGLYKLFKINTNRRH
ncbi:MAG: DUF2892 domain-containing protein [Nanoarchaeota archaeon]